MIDIEKRKFLAELSRLLTFMFDEDRRTALSMYDAMFDGTDDTDALMKLLVSPTRQAVIIARAYNAKERDLAVRSRTGDGDAEVDSSDLPRFVKVIGEIADKAEELCPRVSYSAVWEEPGREEEPEEQMIPEPSDEPEPAQEEEPFNPFAFAVTEFPVFLDDEKKEIHQQETEEPEEVLPQRELPEPEDSVLEGDVEEELSAEEHSNRINEYMAAFAEAEKDNRPYTDTVNTVPAQEEIRTWRDRPVPENVPDEKHHTDEESSGEIKIPLLILYILLAVPLTAVGVLLLLIPAVLCLAISLLLVTVGFQAITTAFGGFAVFADIMVVLGGALVIIAIALCALWAFIWFIGGAIVGLINAAIRLGGKFCTAGGGR